MAKVSVDQEKCIGCGACAATCPAQFEMKDGKAQTKNPNVKKLTCEEEAMDNCPVGAISVKK